MNKLEEFKQNIKGKKVGIVGVGVSNIPAIKYLTTLGAIVTAFDKRENLLEEYPALNKLDIEFILGEDYLTCLSHSDLEYIYRSPGVRPFYPEIEAAILKGAILTSEVEMLIHLCPCRIIAVTGSDGKTTTTTLIAKFLEQAGYKVWLGGNIGTPLFTKLDEIKKDDIVVLELSSFQLMTMKESPDISVITNISPNHLDYHRSYEEYIAAKANIFKYQKPGSKVVFNLDDEYTGYYLKMLEREKLNSKILFFSILDKSQNTVFLDSGSIVSNISGKYEIVERVENVKLVGIHNLANICAAASAVIELSGKEAISKVITTFVGVEHRMELVRELNTVKWYNDSIGTSPSRTIAGIKSFKQKIILIAGGYDKNISYDAIGEYILDKTKLLILMGDTSDKIEKSVLDEKKKRKNSGTDNKIDIVKLSSMEECVNYAYKRATENDIVVLSPASASFDMYKNFEIRGNHFKNLVDDLK